MLSLSQSQLIVSSVFPLKDFPFKTIKSLMSSVVEYVSRQLFIDGVWGTVSSNGYFSCHHDSCPFSLKVTFEPLNDKTRVVVGVESVLFGFHNHETTEKTKSNSGER